MEVAKPELRPCSMVAASCTPVSLSPGTCGGRSMGGRAESDTSQVTSVVGSGGREERRA